MNALMQILPGDVVWRLGWTLLHFVWEGAAIALGAGVLLTVLRRRSAAGRYVVGCGALTLMLAAVLGTFVILPDRTDSGGRAVQTACMTPAAEVAPAAVPNAKEEPARVADTTPPVRPVPLTPTPSAARPRARDVWAGFVQWCEPYLPWVVIVWATGLLVLSLRLVAGWLQVRRMRCGRAEPVSRELAHLLDDLAADLRVHRPVRLVHSTAAHVPMAIGWVRPMILLPVSAMTGLTEDQLRAILAHELAHIRRCDYLVNILQCAVETLLFYHPAVWWLSRRVRTEREHCCDDIAVAACGDRLHYARALAHLEELRHHGIRLAAAASGGSLVRRIRRLLGVPEHRRPGGWLAGALALSLVIMTGVGLRLAFGSQESDAGRPDPALIGTWTFENSVGDDEQMSVFQGGRVLVIYSNGHRDDTRLQNGKVTVQEYGGAETTLAAGPDRTLVQRSRQYTPERKIWKRLDAEPHERLLRILTGPVKRQPVECVRYFVRIVTDGERVTFEGQDTTWEGIRPLLAQVPDRPRTVLELAVASGDVTLRQLNDAQNQTLALTQEFGFEYMSYIGEHAMESKGSDAQLVSGPRRSPQGHKVQAVIAPASQPASQPDGAAEPRNVSGRVLLPDGSPAAGAHVAIVLREHQLRYANGRFDRELHHRTEKQPQGVTATCDAEGRFSIPAPPGSRAVVATHDGGYGEALVNALSDAPIRLQSWSTVAGTVGQGRYPDGRPVQVILHANRAIGATEIGRSDELRFEHVVDVNADGSFRFDRVAPGRYWVHRKLSWRVDGGDPIVDVAPGASLRVTLARTAVGLILGAPHRNLLIHPRLVTLRIEAVSPYPAWSGRTSELDAVATYYSGFLASDEFRAYERENVEIDQNGRFRIENLPPATYKLFVSVLADGAAPAEGPGFRYATTSRTFTVPAAVGGTAAEPVDLGFIIVGADQAVVHPTWVTGSGSWMREKK